MHNVAFLRNSGSTTLLQLEFYSNFDSAAQVFVRLSRCAQIETKRRKRRVARVGTIFAWIATAIKVWAITVVLSLFGANVKVFLNDEVLITALHFSCVATAHVRTSIFRCRTWPEEAL
jgi:Mg2+ and Co2+ transporter CorA